MNALTRRVGIAFAQGAVAYLALNIAGLGSIHDRSSAATIVGALLSGAAVAGLKAAQHALEAKKMAK